MLTYPQSICLVESFKRLNKAGPKDRERRRKIDGLSEFIVSEVSRINVEFNDIRSMLRYLKQIRSNINLFTIKEKNEIVQAIKDYDLDSLKTLIKCKESELNEKL